MGAPDPVDVRLLTAVSESGRVAIPELAARMGMDVRDVAARLAALSTTGLPLVVGVECDQQAIRNALAAANAWTSQTAGQPSGGHPMYPAQQPAAYYPPQQYGYPGQVPPNGPAGPGHGAPHHGSGPQHVSGPQQVGPSGPQHVSGPQQVGPSGPSGPQAPPSPPPGAVPGQPEPMSTWGPPGSAAWARTDQHQPVTPGNVAGKVGSTLDAVGPEGEQVVIQLVEVVDPADFLFTAAGYQLKAGDRAVVVHTEMTNRGSVRYGSLPDQHLVLVAADGTEVSKAPASLTSRPPHKTGIPPGETAGGHTVYVLPDSTQLISVRWKPRAEDETHSLIWDISDL